MVRSSKGRRISKYAPEEGNRYDGIYKVSPNLVHQKYICLLQAALHKIVSIQSAGCVQTYRMIEVLKAAFQAIWDPITAVFL